MQARTRCEDATPLSLLQRTNRNECLQNWFTFICLSFHFTDLDRSRIIASSYYIPPHTRVESTFYQRRIRQVYGSSERCCPVNINFGGVG